MEFDHRQEILAAQVRLLFEQLPSAVFATVVNAAILTAVMWSDASQHLLAGWLVSILLVAVGRDVHRRTYLRRNPSGNQYQRWGRQYLYGVAANGVLWGAAGYLFFTGESYTHQVFLAFVLVGAFFLGLFVGRLVRLTQRGSKVAPYWFQDILAWLSLLAVLGLVVEVLILVVINPGLSPEKRLNLPAWQAWLSSIISFYFGVRS